MGHKKKNKQTFKIIIIWIILIALIAGTSIVAINVHNKKKNTANNEVKEELKILNGTFIYDENIKYEFNGAGKGALYDSEDKYEYTYNIDGDKLMLDFSSDMLLDANYTFTLENDSLKLIGEEGTIGGNYILKKENK